MSAADESTWWQNQGMLEAKEIGGGLWLAVTKMIYTYRLMICDPEGALDFYCYHSLHDALRAYVDWEGRGDAPGPWHRHYATGRRRKNGDPATEEIRH